MNQGSMRAMVSWSKLKEFSGKRNRNIFGSRDQLTIKKEERSW